MAFVATPGLGFNFSRSCIARNPSGVAAFAKPSILAAMFMTIEPMAGCCGGTSGKSQRMIGCKARASTPTRPDFSAKRIIPSHRAMIPASGRASVITAVLHASNAAAVTSASCPDTAPSRTAIPTNPSQIQLSIGGRCLTQGRGRAKQFFARVARLAPVSRRQTGSLPAVYRRTAEARLFHPVKRPLKDLKIAHPARLRLGFTDPFAFQ